ncbi:MAG TPA: ATP-dependent Clp protease ATP-binding subunit [Ktedonobacteraceae bacterium]|nr:ATP-dependent Clp protease ATP-binding subunit [Ktedonobacteraceae bacterium]
MMYRPNRYDKEVRQAVSLAREEARRLRHRVVSTEHLLLGLLRLKDPVIEGLLASLRISSKRIALALDFVMGRGSRIILSEPVLGATARATLERAEQEAAAEQAQVVSVGHLLLAILGEEDGVVAGVLESFGLYVEAVRRQLSALVSRGYENLQLTLYYQSRYETTPALNQLGRDLTLAALAGELDPVVGREAELERVVQVLSRRAKNSPALIGPAGSGKTAIIEALALRIVQGKVPDNLQRCRVVALDIGLLTVGTRFRGDFEERLKLMMREIMSAPEIIVAIDELHLLVHTDVAEGSVAAADLFKPVLARGEFRCIGATTPEEYRKTIAADPALERRFQPVTVAEATAHETLAILQGLRSHYERFHRVAVSDEALVAAVKLSARYIQSRCQPDKAIDLIDEAAARLCMQRSAAPDDVRQLRDKIVSVQREKDAAIALCDFRQALALLKSERALRKSLWQAEADWYVQSRKQRPTIETRHIAEIVAMQTGIPVMQITSRESHLLLHLEDVLRRRVIGQNAALQTLARAIRRARVNIRDGRRPCGSFIFAGPTGVGKTETARALAATLLGDEKALIELDMSEFMESHHVSRLIGAPPGYVGYEQAGRLTEAVRRRPYSVVLFDEIEKAHPRVLDILLQILDDGRLTDARGQSVDFKNTFIIMTTNAGSMPLAQFPMAFTSGRQEEHQRRAARIQGMLGVRDLLRPELLDRIDEVIVFDLLSKEHLRTIVDLMIVQTQQRLAEQAIEVQVTDAARWLLVECGYDPSCGARPLRRVVQRMLEDALADRILRGVLRSGDTALVDACDGTLFLNIQPLEHD